MFGKPIFALATALTVSDALGINCKGSGLCASNGDLIGQAHASLKAMDQGKTFSDGQHITCAKSSVSAGNPSLCIFYQHTGRKFTVAQTVAYVQAIIDHQCSPCGSVPVDGNIFSRGQLTANMFTNDKPGNHLNRRDIFYNVGSPNVTSDPLNTPSRRDILDNAKRQNDTSDPLNHLNRRGIVDKMERRNDTYPLNNLRRRDIVSKMKRHNTTEQAGYATGPRQDRP